MCKILLCYHQTGDKDVPTDEEDDVGDRAHFPTEVVGELELNIECDTGESSDDEYMVPVKRKAWGQKKIRTKKDNVKRRE